MAKRYNRKYDWSDWFSKRRFVLRWGEHYRCRDSIMVQQVRNAAAKLGVSVTVLDERGKITVIVHDQVTAAAGG